MKRLLLCAGLALAFFSTLTAQNLEISGKVVDSNRDPIISATLMVSGTERGTITDFDGNFRIELEPGDGRRTLVVSYSGFSDQSYNIKGLWEAQDVLIVLNQSTIRHNAEHGIALAKLMGRYPLVEAREKQDTGIVLYEILSDVTVTATRAQATTPVTYVEVSREEIQERNLGQDAPYLLKWTPSVVVNSDAGTGTGYTGIWIRGSDPTRTNVTINGIPYNDSESQGVFWVNLPDFSSSADNIQIQRGVGTSTNGAGAFGATIDFSTNQIGEEAKLSLDGSVGSFGTRRGAVNYTSGLLENGLKIDARYSRTASDGYIDRASADLEGYYAGLTYVGDKGAVWRFNAFGGNEVTYQSWNGVTQDEIDEFGRTYNSVGTEKEGEPYDNEVDDYGQRHYQLHYNNEFGGKWSLGLSGHYTRGRGFFEQYKADEDLADYGITPAEGTSAESDLIRRRWLDNHFFGTVYSLRYRPSTKLDVTFGGSANEYQGGHFGEVIWARNAGDSEIRDRYYDNDAVKRDFSNYLRTNYAFAPGLNGYLDLQLRSVSYDYRGVDNGGNPLDQQVSLTFFNPKVGLTYQLGNTGQAYASFGVAQREPNRDDFVDNPENLQPNPEKLLNTEIGIRRQQGAFNYGVNLYHMLYRDQLVVTGELTDVGALVRTNVPNSYRVGLELQGGYQVSDKFTIGGNLALSRNRIVAYTEFLDSYDENFGWLGQDEVLREDTPLAFSPSVVGALDLNYRLVSTARHLLETGLQTKYVGERYVDNSGTAGAALEAYRYADLRLAYTLQPKGDSPLGALRFTVLVRNITDQLYVSNGWSYRYNFAGEETLLKGMYPQAGRNILVGLGLDF